MTTVLSRSSVSPLAAASTNINVVPATVNLSLYAGDDITFLVTVVNEDGSPYDLTNKVPTAQVRSTADAPDPPIAFTCAVTGQNVITLTLTNASTRQLPLKGVWDCQVKTASGVITTVVRGSVTVTEDVTRP